MCLSRWKSCLLLVVSDSFIMWFGFSQSKPFPGIEINNPFFSKETISCDTSGNWINRDACFCTYLQKASMVTEASRTYISLEVVIWRCSIKKLLLEISQNSLENTCARVSLLIKLQDSGLQLYWKRESGTGVFL